jgi:hypothetical protein
MPSLFAALEDRVSDTVDAVMGEPVTWTPMRAAPSGGRRTVDPDRAPLTFTAVFDSGPHVSKALGAVERTATRVSMDKPSVSVDLRRLAGRLPVRLDRITRAGVVYEINDVQAPDGEGRLMLSLDRVGPAA